MFGPNDQGTTFRLNRHARRVLASMGIVCKDPGNDESDEGDESETPAIDGCEGRNRREQLMSYVRSTYPGGDRMTFDQVFEQADRLLAAEQDRADQARPIELTPARNAVQRRMTLTGGPKITTIRKGLVTIRTVLPEDRAAWEADHQAASEELALERVGDAVGQRLAMLGNVAGHILMGSEGPMTPPLGGPGVRPSNTPDDAGRYPGIDQSQAGLRTPGGTTIDVTGYLGVNIWQKTISYLRSTIAGFGRLTWDAQFAEAKKWIEGGRVAAQANPAVDSTREIER